MILSFHKGVGQMITVLHEGGGEGPNDYNITWGGLLMIQADGRKASKIVQEGLTDL